MIAFITGVTGFAGSHLAEYLIKNEDIEVHGIRRPRSRSEFHNPDVRYHEADILDLTSLMALFKEWKPDYIFHLAAQSDVALSWKAPVSTFEANIFGTLNVLEAVRLASPDSVVHVAGSSEEYGYVVSTDCPIDENQPLRPQSPYAVSKVTADLLAQQYRASYCSRTIITRAFNHTGPRRGENFVTSKIAKQCALIMLGKSEPVLTLGNLEAVRDFTDVRDMVRAYWLAANVGQYGVPMNIGSGHGYKIQTVADLLIKLSGKEITIKQDPQFMRPSDVPLLICDNTLVMMRTGWKPQIKFDQTMKDLLDYWCERLK